jgi:hypothetical protein
MKRLGTGIVQNQLSVSESIFKTNRIGVVDETSNFGLRSVPPNHSDGFYSNLDVTSRHGDSESRTAVFAQQSDLMTHAGSPTLKSASRRSLASETSARASIATQRHHQ